MTFLEAREAAHRAISKRPGDVELIAHNYAAVLDRLGVSVDTMYGCIRELLMRRELADRLPPTNHA